MPVGAAPFLQLSRGRAGRRRRRPTGKHLQRWEDLGKTLESLGAPELRKPVKPWGNLGKTLENLGMDSEGIWPKARERAGQGQTKGNVKETQWSGALWKNLGTA